MSPRPSVTLLICTHNRPAKLERCLRAVLSGNEKPDRLVVVNGTDGKTPELVQQFVIDFPETVLVEHPNRNLATLRNLGIPYCTTDIVALTDDDAVPDENWVRAIRDAHTNNDETGGIGGPVRGIGHTFLDEIAERVVFPDPSGGRTIHTLPTVNMSYKREVIETLGSFDENLFRGEDVDYNWRVIQGGWSLCFDPNIRVRHENRSTLAALYQQQYMYGRAYVLVRAKWPDMYAVYPRNLRSVRDWAKLIHAAAAILYQPVPLARSMKLPLYAYAVLVIHHFVWKVGMVDQALLRRMNSQPSQAATQSPSVREWRNGSPM